MIKLGTSADGRQLAYDASRYEFQLSQQPVSFDDVCALERRDWIRWRAPELREWFVKIDRGAIIECNRAAREKALGAQAQPQRFRYRSSDPSVATVDSSGRVRVCGIGVAEILAARASDVDFAAPVRLVTIDTGMHDGTREVRERFKAKGGKLPKAKSFKLPKAADGTCTYEMASGDPGISVSSSGKVTAEKGLVRGLHTAEVIVRGESGISSLLVSVEVK